MKTGINHYFGYPIPNSERFSLIRAAGFDTVYLYWGDRFIKEDGGPKEEQPAFARAAGLHVENVHSDFEGGNLLWTDEPGWEVLFNRYIATIDACHDHRIPTVVLHLTSGEALPAMGALGIERVKRLVERAERKNVNLALENLRVSQNAYMDYVFDTIQSDKLTFCYDSGHENCWSRGDLLGQYGDKLTALHLHDNDGTDDQHLLPGDGTADWASVAKRLQGYAGSISLEVMSQKNGRYTALTAEQFLEEAYRKAQWIAGLTGSP